MSGLSDGRCYTEKARTAWHHQERQRQWQVYRFKYFFRGLLGSSSWFVATNHGSYKRVKGRSHTVHGAFVCCSEAMHDLCCFLCVTQRHPITQSSAAAAVRGVPCSSAVCHMQAFGPCNA